ncbi:MAG: hypothetical protein ACFB21_12650 [Opitutales bacterium]
MGINVSGQRRDHPAAEAARSQQQSLRRFDDQEIFACPHLPTVENLWGHTDLAIAEDFRSHG